MVLTSFGDGSIIQSALELRAEGFVLKIESPVQLVEAIRQVAQGRIIFLTAMGGDRMHRVGQGNPEIAQSMGVSANTIRFHIKSIFSKIQASNRTEVAAWYFSHKNE